MHTCTPITLDHQPLPSSHLLSNQTLRDITTMHRSYVVLRPNRDHMWYYGHTQILCGITAIHRSYVVVRQYTQLHCCVIILQRPPFGDHSDFSNIYIRRSLYVLLYKHCRLAKAEHTASVQSESYIFRVVLKPISPISRRLAVAEKALVYGDHLAYHPDY